MGTEAPDVIQGTVGADSIDGLGENDLLAGDPSLFGPGGNDTVHGGPGDDGVYGRGGDDRVSGGPGNDDTSGTLGADVVSGDEGDDIVDDGPFFEYSVDEISGGPGNDTMGAYNRPAFPDVVECGAGEDRAYTDGSDLIAGDCEELVVGPHPQPWDLQPYLPAHFPG